MHAFGLTDQTLRPLRVVLFALNWTRIIGEAVSTVRLLGILSVGSCYSLVSVFHCQPNVHKLQVREILVISNVC